jgi:phospholipase A1
VARIFYSEKKNYYLFYIGKSVSLDEKTRIVVPEDRYGLYAIDVLDPDMVIHFVPSSFFFNFSIKVLVMRRAFRCGITFEFAKSQMSGQKNNYFAMLISIYSYHCKFATITWDIEEIIVFCDLDYHIFLSSQIYATITWDIKDCLWPHSSLPSV